MISDLPKAAIFYKRKKFGIKRKRNLSTQKPAQTHITKPLLRFLEKGLYYILQLKSFGYFFQEAAAGLRFDRYTFFTEQGSKVFGHKACGNGI